MKPFCLYILFVSFQLPAISQQFDVNIFGDVTDKNIDQVQKNLEEYKRIKKENKRFLSSQKKRYELYQDSTINNHEKKQFKEGSIKQLTKVQRQYFVYTDSLYTLETINLWDSIQATSKRKLLDYSQSRLEGTFYPNKYKTLNQQFFVKRAKLKTYKDSLKKAEVPKYKRDYLIEKKKQELNKQYQWDFDEMITKELKEQQLLDFPSGHPELSEALGIKKMMNDITSSESGAASLNKIPGNGADIFTGKEEKLKKSMNDMKELKNKFSELPNSRDLSTATKRLSLKNKSFKQRIKFGGTFQIHINEIIAIDLNPEISYQLTKKAELGIGGTYKYTTSILEAADSLQQQSVFGYRVFSEYGIVSSFYAHVELEALSVRKPSLNDATGSRNWYYSFLAGVEKRFRFGKKVNGQISILYNFSYRNNPAYHSPWTLRFGFDMNGWSFSN